MIKRKTDQKQNSKETSTHLGESFSVWDELAQSKKLRKDLQHLYELRSRREENLSRFLHNINGHSGRRRMLYYAAAVMVAVLVGLGLKFRTLDENWERPLYSETEVMIPEVHYNVSLKLSTGENRILTDSRLFLFESDGVHITSSPDGKLTYEDFAFSDSLSEKVLYNELVVPRGRTCEIVLTDGTHIHLNAQSKLIYPVSFKKKHAREIYMEGEAYMQVAYDALCPFIVRTPRLQAKVLGTSFNVKDYSDEETCGIVLVEGKLQVNCRTGHRMVLVAGEEVYTDHSGKGLEKRKTVDAESTIAWRHKKLCFNNRTLGDIAKELERRYDICVRFDSPATARYSFLVKAQQFGCIEQVLELLRLTRKVDYKVEGRTVTFFSPDK